MTIPEQVEEEVAKKLKEAYAAYGCKVDAAYHLLESGGCTRQDYDIAVTGARSEYLSRWESIEAEHHLKMGNYAEGR